jgi:regulator of cell morphogenesis and NO signaling
MATDPPASLHDIAEHLLDRNYPMERETMADIAALLTNVACTHGARHPELHDLEAVWADLCKGLRHHLREEQPILAPYVDRDAHAATSGRAKAGKHEEVLALLRRVRALTADYAPPPDACDAYRSLLESLAAFEADLQEHLRLDDLFREARARE